MRYYISASRSNHGRVKTLMEELNKLGHVCAHDWLNDNKDVKSEGNITETAFNIVQSIRDSELFLLVAPFVRSTYAELGLALSSRYSGKRIVVWSESGREFEPGEDACIFFFHPSVIRLKGSFQELIEYIKKI